MRALHVISVAVALLLMSAASAYGSAPAPRTTTESRPASQETPESEAPEEGFEDFNPANFSNPTTIDNDWWPLQPGTRLVYEGFTVEDDEPVPHRVVDTVTDLTKVINGVRTVVSLEEDYSAGELIEKEIAFHAQDDDGNVWHLGQLRETYDEVEFVGGRVWLVGHVAGARAGIRMQADPQLGTPGYSQGYAPPPFNWTDRARVYQMGQTTSVPVGSYGDVLVIEEWDAETPEGVFQLKYYARGVGVVRIGFRGPDPEQEEMELVQIEQLGPEALAQVRAEALEMEGRAYIYTGTPPAEPPLAESPPA
jgi:hypothetical protein